jgi:hypothetical protein
VCHKLLFNECFDMSEFNYELCNQFECEGRIHGHTTSGMVVVLFCFVKCVLNILKHSRTRCIMNLHTLQRQILGEALSSNTDKEYFQEQF